MNASFSTLVLSIGSAAGMFLGLSPHPETNKLEKNLPMAKFNIDLLLILKEKSKNNLSTEEAHLLENLVSDLQLRYVEINK